MISFKLCSILVLCLCYMSHVQATYSRYITQQYSPIIIRRTTTTSSAPRYINQIRRQNAFSGRSNSQFSSVPVVGVSSPNVLQYYNRYVSSSPKPSAFFANNDYNQGSFLNSVPVTVSPNFESTVGRSIPQNLISMYSKRQCPAGTCTYFHSCTTRMQPSKFCSLENGFTGVCCSSGSVVDANTGVFSSIGSNVNSNANSPATSGFFSSNTQTITTREGQTISFGNSGFVPGPGKQTVQIQNARPVQGSSKRGKGNSLPSDFHLNTNAIQQAVSNLNDLEDELSRNHIVPQRNSLGFSHQNFFGTNSLVLKEMQNAFQVLQMLLQFAKSRKMSVQDLINSNIDIHNTDFAQFCPINPICTKRKKYRTVDGSCNNLINTAQGKAVSVYSRLLQPEYADQFNEPRLSRSGASLPNPRSLSLSLSNDDAAENPGYSLMLMSFGQFITHDISRIAITRTHNNQEIKCCDPQINRNPRLSHPACFTLNVPTDDQFLRSESQTCIEFVRSAPALNSRCNLGPREQLNQLSSYIDANNVYGATEAESKKLRLMKGGFMKTSRINNEPFLPLHSNHTTCRIPNPTATKKCFEGGDIRANENIDLVVLHTVFLREHNSIAQALARMNPSWKDEKLYQETRRIIIAQLQHITYNEFLPLLLGDRAIQHFGLSLSSGFSNSYNPIIDGSIMNEFATAGFRLHTLVQGLVNMNTEDNKVVYQVKLRDLLNNPELLYEKNGYEMRLAGLVGQPIHAFDTFFTREITNHLFQQRGKPFGLDLVALNIQRGRDHGLPGYVKYREICGLSPVSSFEDLYRIFSNPGVVNVLRQKYQTVDDIDLFVGGSSEKPLNSGVVGPTFACIIGEQFRRIREGDRFWYENADQDGSFTPAQLAEIKKVTLGALLCRNSHLNIMQPNAFLMPTNANNPKVSCDQLEQMNLRPWAGNQ